MLNIRRKTISNQVLCLNILRPIFILKTGFRSKSNYSIHNSFYSDHQISIFIQDNGQTNLWDGLRAGLEVLAKGQRAKGSNSAIYLLTDGCPNIEPPRGHLPALEKLKQKSNFTCSINTFGFGYDLDSKLLEDISILGNAGSYAFIPDGSFVGTIFVNAITTLLTTVATNLQVIMINIKIN
jgi:hypothetical protein